MSCRKPPGAGLPPRLHHKFRHGHAVWSLQHAPTMADKKAVSLNLMHEDVQVTDGICAPLLGSEVCDRGTGAEPLEKGPGALGASAK